ncbi:MAG: lysylphosphatidylglycerol synthase transmembrane domain-containing protein [Balneolaceae bacterium]|nr:lysylphosphatidylglycerol synthase transmembrane domain-containing protein [Balneolaceae bacterium]
MADKHLLSYVKHPAVKIIFSLAVIIILLFWLPVSDLWESIRKVSFTTWLFVLAGFLFGHCLGAFKWRLLINITGRKLPLPAALRFHFTGLFANLFLPSLAGGDIVKTGLAIQFKKEKGIPIFGTLTDRLIDTASVVFIIALAALLSPNFLSEADQRIVFVMFILLTAISLAIIVFLMLPVHRISNNRIRNLLRNIKGVLSSIMDKPLKPAIAFILSLLIQSIFILLTVYLASDISVHLPLVLWFLVWPLAKLSALLPISLGGIGVREAALVVLLGRLSIPATDAVALGLLWESILITGGIFGGLYYLIHKIITGDKETSIFDFSKKKFENNNLNELNR